MENIDVSIYAEEIKNKYKLGDNLVRVSAGFSRSVFEINDKYILKICNNIKKEKGTKKEISFFLTNSGTFYPKIYVADDTKKTIPYIYTIEEKLHGNNLFSIWNYLNIQERKKILYELVEILRRIHIPVDDYDYMDLITTFDKYLNECIKCNIFSIEQIEYLKKLKNVYVDYLAPAKKGFIHGDVHFDNIIITKDGMKLIDFECYSKSLLDKEFDSIRRMVRNPNSFLRNGESEFYYNQNDYIMIMDYLKELYPEICMEDNFEERLLIYDCINSMKWISKFPEYDMYHNVLFKDSKKLLKK